ncbi:hypothetical protein [Cutibacterium modestum]|uniref:hypothetical protein n=1 Tax=Cutibacterium modestum TaxID=2559073 RepID=UPI001E57A62B|nr:hypothetical protein [Cutibacterium modestum]
MDNGHRHAQEAQAAAQRLGAPPTVIYFVVDMTQPIRKSQAQSFPTSSRWLRVWAAVTACEPMCELHQCRLCQ